MAVTFAGDLLKKQVFGQEYVTHARITVSGTTTDNGDELTAATVGLAKITHLSLDSPVCVDSESNPEAGWLLGVTQPSTGTFNIVFLSQATAGATTAPAVITDGTSVAGVFYVTAYGKC